MPNYDEIASEDTVYLYIKEVAIKGNDQSIAISKSMKLEGDCEFELYVNNQKMGSVETNNSSTKNPEDSTMAPNQLPSTGVKITVIAIIVLMLGIGIFVYVKYKNLSKYVK